MAQDPNQNLEATEVKSGGKKIIIISLITALLAGGGVGSYFYFFKKKPDGKKEKAVVEQQAPVFIPLDSFTVNLQSTSGEHYVQTEMTVQVGGEKDAETIKTHMPEVKNRIISILTSKTPQEILTPEGKDNLNKQIVAELKKPFSGNNAKQAVVGVFFTSFIVQ